MSMADYERAKAIIAANISEACFAGPRPEELVRQAENALGIHFPPTYRQFLLDYGAGSLGSAEFYGVITHDWEDSSIPDGVWYNLRKRRQYGISADFFVIGDTGTGESYVLDLSEEGGPVYVIDPGNIMAGRERVASDFGEFFLQQIQHQEERF